MVPVTHSKTKVAAIRSWGADIIIHGKEFQNSLEFARRHAATNGWHMVESFHPWLVRGVTSYCLEFLRAVPDLDVVYIPIGLGSGAVSMVGATPAGPHPLDNRCDRSGAHRPMHCPSRRKPVDGGASQTSVIVRSNLASRSTSIFLRSARCPHFVPSACRVRASPPPADGARPFRHIMRVGEKMAHRARTGSSTIMIPEARAGGFRRDGSGIGRRGRPLWFGTHRHQPLAGREGQCIGRCARCDHTDYREGAAQQASRQRHETAPDPKPIGM